MADTLELLLIPFLTGLLVLAGHVPLGREVLRRGIIFIDLCIAQVAALGLIVADRLQIAEPLAGVVAAAAAVGTGLLLSWTEPRFRHLQEAIIGSVYVVSAAVVMLLLAGDPHGAEALDRLLAGQLLWVSWTDLQLLAGATALVIVAELAGWLQRRAVFYVLFALAVTASVSLIGVFLVFASLVLPALAANGARRALRLALCTGGIGYAAGLLLSLQLDLPAGPAVICALASLAVLVMLVRRSRGS